jgi:hypothetical protein
MTVESKTKAPQFFFTRGVSARSPTRKMLFAFSLETKMTFAFQGSP